MGGLLNPSPTTRPRMTRDEALARIRSIDPNEQVTDDSGSPISSYDVVSSAANGSLQNMISGAGGAVNPNTQTIAQATLPNISRNSSYASTMSALTSARTGLSSASQTGLGSGNAYTGGTGFGANSSGGFYGNAGSGANVGGTTYNYDSAGNRILGTMNGRNIITGAGNVDRTAGVTGNAMGQWAQFTDPNYFMGRAQDIQRQVERQMQGTIDAINQRYEGQVRREEQAGQEDLARQRSMNLRAGLGGSDFGAANKAEVRNRTSANVRDIQANQDVAVGNAMLQIEQIAQNRIQMEQTAMQNAFSNTVAMQGLKMQMQSQAKENIKELGAAGLDMETIKKRDPALYESITSAAGIGEVQAEYLMNTARKAAEKVDYTWQVVGNKVLGYGVDPRTGELKQVSQDLAVDVPKNYSVSFAPDGTMMMVPDQFDPNIPAEQQIKIAGNYAKPETVGSGNGFTPYQVFQATQALKKNTTNMTAASNELKRQVGNMETAWNRLESGEAKDLNGTSQAIITTFNKILDPTSVVRESEYDRSPQGQALIGQIEGKINAITQGGPGLTKQSLKELVDLGKAFAEGAQANIDIKNAMAREEAMFFGLNPDFIVPEADVTYSGSANNDPEVQAATVAPIGSIVYLNGKPYRKLGEDNYQELSSISAPR